MDTGQKSDTTQGQESTLTYMHTSCTYTTEPNSSTSLVKWVFLPPHPAILKVRKLGLREAE